MQSTTVSSNGRKDPSIWTGSVSLDESDSTPSGVKYTATPTSSKIFKLEVTGPSPSLSFSRSIVAPFYHSATPERPPRGGPVYSVLDTDISPILTPDVPLGRLVVSGGSYGRLSTWDMLTGTECRDLVGHKGDVNACSFFPSGHIVLSGGSDTTVQIWSLELEEHPSTICRPAPSVLTLKGHSLGVTDVGIIGVGRNVCSSSRDGSFKVWDCSSASAVLSIDLSPEIDVQKPSVNAFCGTNSAESTSEATFVAVTEDGRLIQVDTREKYVVTTLLRVDTGLNCVSTLTNNRVVCGGEDGVLRIVDMRQGGSILSAARQGESPVTSVASKGSFLISGYQSGSCSQWNVDPATSQLSIVADLTGADFDPIHSLSIMAEENISMSSGTFVVAGGDGESRVYGL